VCYKENNANVWKFAEMGQQSIFAPATPACHNVFTLKINTLKPVSTPAGLTFWSACLLVISMVLSPFLLSISMWGLAAAALWHTADTFRQQTPGGSLRQWSLWQKAVVLSFVQLWQKPALAALSLLLLVPAISIFWSDDPGYWLRVTRVRLPFLVLPWAFANLPVLSPRQYRQVLYLLVWFMVLACVGVGINFMLHYDAIMDGLGRGQPVPVPRQHVRFSLVLATAIVAGAWLWCDGYYQRFRRERYALLAAVAFLFVFIHVLSVRGGLAVLYTALMVSVVWYIRETKKWAVGIVGLLCLGLLLWAAVVNIPSLRQRVAYMRYDWERYKANDGQAYSDAERWVSLEVGYQIWQDNPLLGTGAGDLMEQVKAVSKAQFPEYAREPKLPHNQWLHIMASTGIVGLLLSLAAFLIPVFQAGNRSNYLYITFQCMAFVTFIIECTIENAIGVSWYLFYTLWFVQGRWHSPENTSHG
jgi:O-antigen ligase